MIQVIVLQSLFSLIMELWYVETCVKCRFPAVEAMLLQDTWVVPDPVEWEWPTPQPVDTGAQLLTMLLLFAVVVLCIACVFRLRKKNPAPTVPLVVKTPAPLVLVVCPYCGTKNEQGIISCRKCGAEI